MRERGRPHAGNGRSNDPQTSNPADGAQLPLRATYVLSRLSRVVQRMLEAILRDHGLTLPQYTLLTVLRRRPGLSNAQLARRAYITPQSMQEVLRGLERRGLVQRQLAPGNRRTLRARLTARGERLTEQAESAAAAADEAMLADFTPARRKRFLQSLQACVVSLDGGLSDRGQAVE
ncbi:MAG TPA: MarR family transcriptional regulator [Nevskiaceae bacterium]